MNKKIFFAGLLTILFFLASSRATLATSHYLAADQDVKINDDYPNDVYAMGQTIEVNGNVDGDFFALAQNIKINGDIKGDVRVAAQTVEIYGIIGGNLQVAAQTIDISGANVGKEVNIYGQDVKINNSTKIAGELIYSSPTEANIANNTEILGGSTWKKSQNDDKAKNSDYDANSLAWDFVKLVGLILVGLFPLYAFSKSTKKIVSKIENPKSLLWGLLFIFVGPIAIFFIAITLVGLPLSLIALCIYIIAVYLGTIYIGIFLGEKITKKSNFWTMLLGITLFFILKNIPYLGFFVSLVGAVWATGAMLMSLKNKTINSEHPEHHTRTTHTANKHA